ncbi:MAG: bifunctional proline dehydrogenase/L-glutamate gamma-semialdehyde dehydrogenase, partial [Planctomycetota bacterium]
RADAIDFRGSVDGLTEGVRPILEAARKHGVLVNFDMEQYALKDLTLELFERCAGEVDFPAGLALQSYLRTGEEDARRIAAWAKRTGRQVTVRLIKGAYWDYEMIHAERMGWPAPVWTDKRDTDACFERMAEILIASIPRAPGEGGVKLALGSHNVRSIAHALALLEKHGLPQSAVELQMLYGMADELKAAALKRGLRVREYVPVGEMIPGMAYLVRRLLENTSNQSWLRAGFAEDLPDEKLLASPHRPGGMSKSPDPENSARRPEHHRLSPAVEGLGDGRPLANEPVRDFAEEAVRERFRQAVRSAVVPEITGEGTREQAAEAVTRASRAFPSWRDVEPIERSRTIVKAASLLRDRRDELAGIMVREAGKTWREADADVAEAIDFCEYYARSAVGLFEPDRLGRFVGELNHTWYQPRGVAVVISPWNFPLAIATGMTTAALVTGNTVIVKPSGQTPGIAKVMCEVLHEAGVPGDVLQFLPGRGSVVGAALVRNPRVALIAFTGSKEVGLDILQAAGPVPESQGFVKKVVAEMGGKNAIVVDESADLDEAVLGVRQSAFGYSGQKCSACSRVIVVGAVYDVFLKRLVESTEALVIGDPAEPGTDVGPVIDESAARKIRRYIEIGGSEGALELACEVPPGLEEKVGKPYVGPHIFSGIRPDHRLANEEIFGPVLSVMRAATFQEASDVANATAYKLTGGVFSRKPSHLELARREFRVGNLYLNRGITGALVGRQPFGGFGLSGTGTKAGGADYLRHFVEPRAVTENTMRHGFAPGLE